MYIIYKCPFFPIILLKSIHIIIPLEAERNNSVLVHIDMSRAMGKNLAILWFLDRSSYNE